MFTEISRHNTEALLTRFEDFHDGLIRSIYVNFAGPRPENMPGVIRSVVVVLSAQDWTVTDNDRWVNVILKMIGVSDFVLVEGNTTSVVLSRGLSVGFFENRIHLAFDAEAQSFEEFTQANFQVVCQKCTYDLAPYNEGSE